jgi:hypothetical protein
VQSAAGSQHAIADNFRIEALHGFPPIETVFRIALFATRVVMGGLAICGRGHDQFV